MEDKAKTKIVKGILLFSAIVIVIVSIYTTSILFNNPRIDFSPNVKSENKSSNETNNTLGVSFVLGKDVEKYGGGENYDSRTIPRLSPEAEREMSSLISPLAIYDGLEGRNGKLFLLLAILEIIVIYFVYRRVERKVVRRKS